jgi:hypothetical protein
MILVYWIIQSLRYQGRRNFGLGLSRKQLLALLVMEVVWFLALYLFYLISQSPNTADSFAWRNMFLYFRGVVPIIGLAAINDHTFRFLNDPTWECFVMVLVVDYIFLLLVSIIKKRRKKYLQNITQVDSQ